MGIVDSTLSPRAPKYKQIVSSIEEAICNGILKKGDRLPSLNKLKVEQAVSRDTVLAAFNILKTRGIIKSVVGKGYYVASENVTVNQKIFLLFDELNSFKEDLYNAFLNAMNDNIQVDIFFHHFNIEVFSKLIDVHAGDYSYYVIMPANLKETAPIIERLPIDKVYILDQLPAELSQYPAIYQNFKKDIYNSLEMALEKIEKYTRLLLLYSEKNQPKGILDGFNLFCEEHYLQHEVTNTIENRVLSPGELFIVLDDTNLIKIIKRIKDSNMVLARDIGIISYNDTLLKEIVEGGITTISTNFKHMGERLASMILNNEHAQVENPNQLIIRKSL